MFGKKSEDIVINVESIIKVKDDFNEAINNPGIQPYNIPPGAWYERLADLRKFDDGREAGNKLKKLFIDIARFYNDFYREEAKRVIQEKIHESLGMIDMRLLKIVDLIKITKEE